MSTILDSLKKSSNQRNNSDGGSLDNFNFSNDKEPSTSFSKIVMILFIALVFVASFWIYQNYFVTEVDITEASTDNSASKQATTKTAAKSEEANITQSSGKKDKPNSDAIKAQIKQIKDRKEIARRTQQLSEINRKDAPPSHRSEKQDVSSEVKSHRSLVKTDKYKTDENRSNQKPTKKSAIKSPKDLKNKQKPNNSDQHRLLYQLPFAIRKEVPEIKLNIHVYDEVSENRIAIINGTRFAINDMITDQVMLKDILVNGILLDYNGTEFFVPN